MKKLMLSAVCAAMLLLVGCKPPASSKASNIPSPASSQASSTVSSAVPSKRAFLDIDYSPPLPPSMLFFSSSAEDNLKNYKVISCFLKDFASSSDVNLKKAQALYKSEKYGEAFDLLLKSAEQGNEFAQCFLGYSYFEGIAVDNNYAEAIKWFRIAANNGNPFAQHCLGVCHIKNGCKEFCEQSLEEAERWFLKAANQGFAASQAELGAIYAMAAWGGHRNKLSDAMYWLEQAADRGHEEARRGLFQISTDRRFFQLVH